MAESVSTEGARSGDAAPALFAPVPRALMFNLETTTPKGAALHELFAAVGLLPRDVAPRELALPVGYLAGLPGFSAEPCVDAPAASSEAPAAASAAPDSTDLAALAPAAPNPPAFAAPVSAGSAAVAAPAPADEFVLFCHLPDDEVMGVIRLMKAAGLTVGCKATLTEFNRTWPFGKLVREVAEEHAAMERFRAQRRAEQEKADQR